MCPKIWCCIACLVSIGVPTPGLSGEVSTLYATEETPVDIQFDGYNQTFAGRISFDLRAIRDGAQKDKIGIIVNDFYVVIFGFPYAKLVPNTPPHTPKYVTLGITTPVPRKPISFGHDKATRTLTANVPVRLPLLPLYDVDAKTYAETHHNLKNILFQTGRLDLEIKLDADLDPLLVPIKEVVPATLSGKITMDKLKVWDWDIKHFKVWGWDIKHFSAKLAPKKFVLNIASLQDYVSIRNLCIQPVSIQSGASDLDPTGMNGGLSCRLDSLKLWHEVGMNGTAIEFEQRPWITIDAPDLKVVEETEEIQSFPDLSADCIEVFFVKNCFRGGGITQNEVTAQSYVVAVDSAAPGCALKVMLAHELGHIMNLVHPGEPPYAHIEASSGTLMCGTGDCATDPRAMNSSHNIDGTVHSLFTVGTASRVNSADCHESADCGACDAPQ